MTRSICYRFGFKLIFVLYYVLDEESLEPGDVYGVDIEVQTDLP